jgi:hypothetical protein
MASEEHKWVVQPDSARIDLAVSHEVKAAAQLSDALDPLARALEQSEGV